MTVITNMVVALMIVTQGEEAIRAVPVKELVCDPPISYLANERVVADGLPETLYRKTCKTNFVYSTTIPHRAFRCQCHYVGCSEMHTCTIDELFGRTVRAFAIEHDDPAYCERHKKLLK